MTALSPPDLTPIQPLLDLIIQEWDPDAIWLFGSRARGTAQPDSDWDLMVVVPDAREEAALNPMIGYELKRRVRAHADVIFSTSTWFREGSSTPNTLAYEVFRCGGILIYER